MTSLGNCLRRVLAGAALTAIAPLGIGAAGAETLDLTETVVANGSIDGVVFTDQLITLTATAEGTPQNIRPPTSPYKDWRLDLSSLSLTVGSIFSGDLDPTSFYVFVNDKNDSAGIGTGPYDMLDLVGDPFATYDLTTALTTSGPLSFYGETVPTSAGDFTISGFDPGDGNVTFTASLAPEPGAWMLAVGGFGLAGAALRRKRAPAIA